MDFVFRVSLSHRKPKQIRATLSPSPHNKESAPHHTESSPVKYCKYVNQ